jgi:serine/threonine protein kinase
VLSAVRRRDLNYRDVNTRIEGLKAELTSLDVDDTGVQSGQEGFQNDEEGFSAESLSSGPGSDESRYEIIDEVGRGGMGVVYKAKDTHLGRIVALKRLPENLRQHPTAVKFFEREARSAAILNHPNIVTVFDAGQENGTYFITMELLEGTPLDEVMTKHKVLPPVVVARLGVQIATGLQFAHRNKIIHRDIKTANLFLTRDKIVKIMDFGLAKMVEEVRKGATVIGGTPYYMAPEQASGKDVDHRADLYALGITLYQMSTGNLPFTEGDINYHHNHTPPPDPRTFKPDLPPQLATLILKLIEKEPDARIQNAADVVQVLQALIDSAPAKSNA